MSKRVNSAFTLIELLVVISIIGILIALSIFGLQGARESSRDARRKADLELIRSGLEIYKSDCNSYPAPVNGKVPSPLTGNGSSTGCATTNTYIQAVPKDPLDPNRTYPYTLLPSGIYGICAALEQTPPPGQFLANCGSCGVACNYAVGNP